jgi:hypothetical protein
LSFLFSQQVSFLFSHIEEIEPSNNECEAYSLNHYTPYTITKNNLLSSNLPSQVFSPEIVSRKPNEELLFLFHAVCSLLDAMADRGSTGNSLSFIIMIIIITIMIIIVIIISSSSIISIIIIIM